MKANQPHEPLNSATQPVSRFSHFLEPTKPPKPPTTPPTLTHPNLEPDGGLIVFHILGPHNFLASEERPAKDFLMCAHKI